MPDTPYVIIVHGTWNEPRDGATNWYQPKESDPSHFCTRLNTELEAHGLGRPIGQTLGGKQIEFAWTGYNDHASRIAAAKQLADLIQQIERHDPSARIHFVAHSHGGNVLLAALEEYQERLAKLGRTIFRDIHRRKRWSRSPIVDCISEALKHALPPALAEARFHSEPIEELFPAYNEYYPLKGTSDSLAWPWATSRSTNRIGHLVFMGTPFLWKYWKRSISWWSPLWIIDWLINLTVTVVLAAAATYVGAILFGGSLWVGNAVMLHFGIEFMSIKAASIIVVGGFIWAALTAPYGKLMGRFRFLIHFMASSIVLALYGGILSWFFWAFPEAIVLDGDFRQFSTRPAGP